MLGSCTETRRGPVLYGSRVAWYAPDDQDEDRLVVRLYDLDTGQTGVLDRFDEPEGSPGGLDVSDRWIVRSAEGDEGAPAEMPGAFIGYDVDTMTRLYDLEDYVSSFTVARSTSMSVSPAVEGSNVVWSEPTTYAGGDWRLMTLLIARDRVSLPMVWH